ncbi:hypothetical protein ANCCAN_26573 [Ancylostoma caninum]|uniref:Uncharacterized protein n=1 Tax=Ancylostoma caninum TaxID=29170 RepID=A0A368F9T7_ANCCA|nr:hypothetical protein ANCCAN_26573 [Ancylostoma caninum]
MNDDSLFEILTKILAMALVLPLSVVTTVHSESTWIHEEWRHAEKAGIYPRPIVPRHLMIRMSRMV